MEERITREWMGVVPPLFLWAAQAGNSNTNKEDLLFWSAVLIITLLVFFIAQKVVRYGIQSKVRSIHRELGIGPDDLDRMSKSGLLTEEERKKIQEAVARNLMRVTEESARRKVQGKASAEQILSASLREDETGGREPAGKAPPQRKEGSRFSQIQPLPSVKETETPPSPTEGGRQHDALSHEKKGLAKPSAGKPAVDLEALLAKGLITPEEYEQLRENRGKDL